MENQCSQIMMFRKRLQNRLSPMRYEHSLSVSFTCTVSYTHLRAHET